MSGDARGCHRSPPLNVLLNIVAVVAGKVRGGGTVGALDVSLDAVQTQTRCRCGCSASACGGVGVVGVEERRLLNGPRWVVFPVQVM